jgi:protocatechuate 3,4-dioxygenase beta subunit
MLSWCQDQIKGVDEKLQHGKITVTQALTDTSLMPLHSLTPFRELIMKNARSEKITLVTSQEPGTRITVKGTVMKNGVPQPGLLVYVYQTSSKGWYSDTGAHVAMNEGDRRHARLFGYFKTDDKGNFAFETIKPHGYPGSDLPAHIHFEVFENVGDMFITELLFDDDERLTPAARKRAASENFIISKNTGTPFKPVYEYMVLLR